MGRGSAGPTSKGRKRGTTRDPKPELYLCRCGHEHSTMALVSRQRLWRIKQRLRGRCIECGVETDGPDRCAKHNQRTKDPDNPVYSDPHRRGPRPGAQRCSLCGEMGHNARTHYRDDVEETGEGIQ